MNAQPRDQEQRDEATTWVHGPVLVEAGAGTGKTTLLVERILHLIRSEGVRLGEIAAITFTRKATAELKDRIRREILSAVQEEDAGAKERLQDALENIESARISTIHSFALNILRGFSVEAGLRPEVGDVDETEYEARRDAAWRDWLMEELNGNDRRLRDFLDLGFTVSDLEKIRDALLDMPELREHFPRLNVASLDEIRASITETFAGWVDFGKRHCSDESDKAFLELEKAENWLESLLGLSKTVLLRELWNPSVRMKKNVGSPRKWGDSADEGRENLKLFRAGYDRFLQDSAAIIAHEMLAGLVSIVRGFVESFEREMREAGVLSYQDILFLAAKLVRENPGARRRIRESIKHFLIDEFQDTDPLQVELIFLLTGESQDVADWREARMDNARLFLVGDPKQSIYRFRRADIAIYHEVKERIRALPSGRVLHIKENFRSTPGVVDFVNEAFSRVIRPEAGVQPPYVELIAHRESSNPGVFLIQKQENGDGPEDGGRMKEEERRKNEAACLAAAIRELVEERKLEIGEGDARRPVNYGDIAVLFRVRTGYRQFEDAFRGADVSFVSDGGHGFYDKFEVGAAISVLSAVVRPGDTLALAAALRSPLYGFSDVDIARYFLKTHEPPGELKEAVREMHLLHNGKKDLSARSLLEEIYRRTQAFELFLASSGGEQRVANLLKLLDMAHEFAGNGKRGVDAFAAHLEAQYDLGREAKEPEAFLDTHEGRAVRFMTIHQAKGLEFPVVALADLEGRPDKSTEAWIANYEKGNEVVDLHLGSSTRWLNSAGYADALEREKQFREAEIKRLWYVGATRAQDYLLWPESGFRFLMKSAGLKEEEVDDVIQGAPASPLEVSPGESKPLESILRVPDGVFRQVSGRSVSLANQRVALDEKLKRLKKPIEVLKPLAPSGLVKGFDEAEPATSWALFDEDESQDLEIHAGGVAFGRLVHVILAKLEPPEPERLEGLREESIAYARTLGLGDDDTALATELIRNSMSGGVLARAAAASRRWRELAFMFELDGRMIRGFIDLVFEEEGKLTLVDFKTDKIAANEADQKALFYANQGGAYVMGLEAATGLEVHELVFSFLRPGVDVSCPVDDVLRERVCEAVAEAE